MLDLDLVLAGGVVHRIDVLAGTLALERAREFTGQLRVAGVPV
jgi:hypothetical protein